MRATRTTLLMLSVVFQSPLVGAQTVLPKVGPQAHATGSVSGQDGSTRRAIPAAESTETDPGMRPPSREVEIHAGHVEIEGPLKRLSLSKGVELTVHRYHVNADRMTLEYTTQGISVHGNGRVAFCPCAGPPLTVGFTRATVAPPTDLLLRNATFRACGIPIFWLPAFWVRSPNKLGLVTPQLGWRGSDGPWIRSGVHVPISSKPDASDGAIEALTGVYLQGGIDVGLELRTARSTTLLRWDYLERGFLVVDASGYSHTKDQVSLTWRIDSLRGARARTGAVSFETGSRNNDRFRTELSLADGRSLYALGFHGDVGRAARFSEIGHVGPIGRWGIGAAIGDFGRVDSSTMILGRFLGFDRAHAMALHVSEFGVDMRPGPMVARWTIHERWLLASGSQSAYDAGLLGTELRVGLPLVAEFDSYRSGFGHWLEPFVLANAAIRSYGQAYAHEGRRPVATAQVGVTNKLGTRGAPTAMSLQLRAGQVIEGGRETRALAARWLASGNWLALGGDAGWAGKDAWLSVLRARVGRVDRLALRSRLEGRGHTDPLTVRWLLDEAWSPWQGGWFSRASWFVSEDVDMMLGYQVALSSGIAYDVVHDQLVAKRVGVSYRHPCGCLAVNTHMDWRVGREGMYLWMAFDLMP